MVKSSLDVRVDKDAGFTVARVSGDLMGPNVSKFGDAMGDLMNSSEGPWAVDLSQVGAIDSSALSVLMNLVARARLSSGRVVLLAPSRFVAEVFRVTKLNTWFDIRETLA